MRTSSAVCHTPLPLPPSSLILLSFLFFLSFPLFLSPVPPNITRDPASPQDNPLVLREEESVVVNLIISANPQPASFIWTRNGVNVTSGNGLILDGTTFIVDPANRELSGTYMLCVINSAGPGCFEIVLDIQCKA